MTPANPLSSQPAPQAAPQGVFGKIGLVLPGIANRLAAAFGNYGPLHEEQRQQQLKMQQDTAASENALRGSQLETNALNRQHLQQTIANTRTPEQQGAAALAGHREELEQNKEFERPTDIVAPMPEGGMGHYNSKWNPQTHGYETTPTMIGKSVPNPTLPPPPPQPTQTGMVGPQPASPPPIPPLIGGMPLLKPAQTVTQQTQLPAMTKPAGSGMIVPDQNSPTGYSKELYDGMGNVISRIPNALPPAPFVPSESNSSRTTPKQDVNGNWVDVPESSSSSKTPTLPGIPNQARPSSGGGGGVAQPIKDTSGNPLHGPLSADAKKNISQISTTQKMIDGLLPELEARIKQSGGDMNSLWDAGMQRAAWAEYIHGGVIPDNVDPALAHLLPTIAQLKIVGGLPYLRGTRSFQYIQQIQQHLPDPEKDSPALMVDKIRSLQRTMPILRQSVLESEGVNPPPAGPPTPPVPGAIDPKNPLGL